MNTMYPDSLLRQFIYESEQWGRLLSFLKQENVILKSRLAEAVNIMNDNELLVEAEKFQDDFLLQDRAIDFLSVELRKHRKLLDKDLSRQDELPGEVLSNHNKLKDDIQKAEQIFLKVKQNFSEFIAVLLRKKQFNFGNQTTASNKED